MSTQARSLNYDALAKLDDSITKDEIGTGDLAGGELPRALFDEFLERTQEEAILLDLVRTEEMARKQMAIPKVGVSNRVLQTQAEGAAPGAFEDATSGAIELDASRKTILPFELTQEAVEDVTGGEAVADIILSHFETQFGVDVQDILINGDSGSTDSFLSIADGFLNIARDNKTNGSNRIDGATMPSVDTAGSVLDSQVFSDAIQAQEEKYRDSQNQVFLMSETQHQAYLNTLRSREDALGTAVLNGSEDVTPFGYALQPVPDFPDSTLLLTNPNNLIWGVHRNIEVDVRNETDRTLERDLFARYVLRARWDTQIEELQAGTIVENLAAP